MKITLKYINGAKLLLDKNNSQIYVEKCEAKVITELEKFIISIYVIASV